MAGEEITVNYGYKVDSTLSKNYLTAKIQLLAKIPPQLSFAPPWYQEQWFEHVREVEGWDETKIKIYCSNVSRR